MSDGYHIGLLIMSALQYLAPEFIQEVLQKEMLLETYDQEVTGRNRRYYRITKAGTEKLKFYKKAWKTHVEDISDIVLRGEIND